MDLHRRWSDEAGKLMAIAADGRREAAIARMFTGTFPDIGVRATNVLEQWVDHNEQLATTAGNSSLTALTNSRRNLLIVVALVLLFTGIGGTITFPAHCDSYTRTAKIGRRHCGGRLFAAGALHGSHG